MLHRDEILLLIHVVDTRHINDLYFHFLMRQGRWLGVIRRDGLVDMNSELILLKITLQERVFATGFKDEQKPKCASEVIDFTNTKQFKKSS